MRSLEKCTEIASAEPKSTMPVNEWLSRSAG
jgi:hypothetical protein